MDDLKILFQDIAKTIDAGSGADATQFDEQTYLRYNPDIALAVEQGKFFSGYQHYLEFGRREGRVFEAPAAARQNQFLFVENTEKPANQTIPEVHLEVVMMSPHGLFLNGWSADANNPIERVHIRGPGWSFWIGPELLARVRRHDVEEALKSGVPHPYGFWSFIASERQIPTGPCIVNVVFAGETRSQHTVTPMGNNDEDLRNIVLGYLHGSHHFGNPHVGAIATIERGIGRQIVDFNKGVSASIVSRAHVERFHVSGRTPKASIVVCLYGKPEFLFVQAALFHRCQGMQDYEFIYVSNSPDIIDRLLAEARIASRIYGIDQTCVLLAGNAGFGAANNVAVRHARSSRILILNPDVFPHDPLWAVRHTDLVEQAPAAQTKLFGAPLFYDDGSLMHGGMYFDIDRPLLTRAGSITSKRLVRVEHYGKGAPADDAVFTRPRPVAAVTGAFASVDRGWFERLGGFTEDYVFGHYEDADLCLKSSEQGVSPWLQDIRLWHLEGKGSSRLPVHEGGSLVNRWLFSDTWADRIEANYTLGPANVRAVLDEYAALDSNPPTHSSRTRRRGRHEQTVSEAAL